MDPDEVRTRRSEAMLARFRHLFGGGRPPSGDHDPPTAEAAESLAVGDLPDPDDRLGG